MSFETDQWQRMQIVYNESEMNMMPIMSTLRAAQEKYGVLTCRT